MFDWLQDAIPHRSELPIEIMFIRLGLAFAFGGAVAAIYYGTHRRDETYQPTFISTLVLLTILIALVTEVIGGSVARAFSLVGALSIVRFRTIVQDTRDTAFVIFAVVLGMAVGGGHWQVALAGLVVGGLAAAVLAPRGRLNSPIPLWSLTVRVGIAQDPATLDPVLRKHLERRDITGTSTSRQGAALDLTYRVRLHARTTPTALVAELNQLEGVQQVELHQL